jgi:aminobenzoyl-glutamate utilization protein B
VWYVFRNPSREYTNILRDYVYKAAEGASNLTECSVEIKFITGIYPKIPNKYLSKLQYDNLVEIGPPRFSDKEKDFAYKLIETYPTHMGFVGGGKYDETRASLDETLTPPRGHSFGDYMGTTDEGDVSWIAPLVSLSTACHPIGCPGHSWQKVAASGSSIAHKGLIVASKTLSSTGIDLILNPKHIKEAHKEFDERKAGKVYKSVIPSTVKPILDWHTEYQNEYREKSKH